MTDKKNTPPDTLPLVACSGQIELPTPKERESLDAMREIKERTRKIKETIRRLKDSGGQSETEKISELEAELKHLKQQWAELEIKWKKAVKERMIYLGHDEA